jgi:hypothetical protein
VVDVSDDSSCDASDHGVTDERRVTIADATVAEIDKMSRADLERFAELARDLADPEVMRQAWS